MDILNVGPLRRRIRVEFEVLAAGDQLMVPIVELVAAFELWELFYELLGDFYLPARQQTAYLLASVNARLPELRDPAIPFRHNVFVAIGPVRALEYVCHFRPVPLSMTPTVAIANIL